ncbi:MAG TPA: hypothetical protein VK121_07970 [Pseudogracilibacillus sp.]|nr:hypothetical protein [Pseudogracilibacillus sp.]
MKVIKINNIIPMDSRTYSEQGTTGRNVEMERLELDGKTVGYILIYRVYEYEDEYRNSIVDERITKHHYYSDLEQARKQFNRNTARCYGGVKYFTPIWI